MEPAKLVQEALRDTGFWGEDFSDFTGFQNSVIEKLNMIIEKGIKETISFVQSKKVFA